MAILDETNLDEKTDAAIFDEWDKLAKYSVSVSEYETAVAEKLQQTACVDRGAPYVIRGIFGRFSPGSTHPARIAGILVRRDRTDWRNAPARLLSGSACRHCGPVARRSIFHS
jgi:hypothetical protein